MNKYVYLYTYSFLLSTKHWCNTYMSNPDFEFNPYYNTDIYENIINSKFKFEVFPKKPVNIIECYDAKLYEIILFYINIILDNNIVKNIKKVKTTQNFTYNDSNFNNLCKIIHDGWDLFTLDKETNKFNTNNAIQLIDTHNNILQLTQHNVDNSTPILYYYNKMEFRRLLQMVEYEKLPNHKEIELNIYDTNNNILLKTIKTLPNKLGDDMLTLVLCYTMPHFIDVLDDVVKTYLVDFMNLNEEGNTTLDNFKVGIEAYHDIIISKKPKQEPEP